MGAVWIAARNNQYIDPIEELRALCRGQASGQSKRGFAASGLVAMLLADDEDRWLTALQQIGAAAHRGTSEHEQRNGAVLLRLASDAYAQIG